MPSAVPTLGGDVVVVEYNPQSLPFLVPAAHLPSGELRCCVNITTWPGCSPDITRCGPSPSPLPPSPLRASAGSPCSTATSLGESPHPTSLHRPRRLVQLAKSHNDTKKKSAYIIDHLSWSEVYVIPFLFGSFFAVCHPYIDVHFLKCFFM